MVHAVEWALARAYFLAAWRELDRERGHAGRRYLEADAGDLESLAGDAIDLALRSVFLTAEDREATRKVNVNGRHNAYQARLSPGRAGHVDLEIAHRPTTPTRPGCLRDDHVQDVPAFLGFPTTPTRPGCLRDERTARESERSAAGASVDREGLSLAAGTLASLVRQDVAGGAQ